MYVGKCSETEALVITHHRDDYPSRRLTISTSCHHDDSSFRRLTITTNHHFDDLPLRRNIFDAIAALYLIFRPVCFHNILYILWALSRISVNKLLVHTIDSLEVTYCVVQFTHLVNTSLTVIKAKSGWFCYPLVECMYRVNL